MQGAALWLDSGEGMALGNDWSVGLNIHAVLICSMFRSMASFSEALIKGGLIAAQQRVGQPKTQDGAEGGR